MKKIFILYLFLSTPILLAQYLPKIEMRFTASSLDHKQQRIITGLCEPDKSFEGYFSIHDPFAIFLSGKLQSGGFSFIEPEVFGWAADELKKEWVKNKFAGIGVEALLNGSAFRKALSYKISPVVTDVKNDSLNIFFKYVVHTRVDTTNFSKNEFDINTKLFYKQFIFPLRKEINLNFLSSIFNGYEFKIWFDYYRGDETPLPVEMNDDLYAGITKSLNDSHLQNANLNIGIDFTKRTPLPGNRQSPYKFFAYINQPALQKYFLIQKEKTNSSGQVLEKFNFKTPVYYAQFTLPFELFDAKKMDMFDKYKTKEKIFQSSYTLLLVPISTAEEGVTADLYIQYTKLNLGDGIPRWTPIKKRIVIPYKKGLRIDLPKENWTANFTRAGEQYDIYGYSDYERYVDETIVIKLD